MRLRYLHIRHYPPLEDVELALGPPALPGRECAIRFVVGVNGSGKTHLLQAVAETFVALANQRPPHFPITLIYELGEGEQNRLLVFKGRGPGREPRWWQSTRPTSEVAVKEDNEPFALRDWRALLPTIKDNKQNWQPLIQQGNWPGKGVGLPEVVLAYTTGCIDPWQILFRSEPNAGEENIASQSEDYDVPEHPAGWSRERQIQSLEQEIARHGYEKLNDFQRKEQRKIGDLSDYEFKRMFESLVQELQIYHETIRQAQESWEKVQEQQLCHLLDPVLLKFALLAVSLRQAMDDYREYATDEAATEFMQQIRDNPDGGEGLRRLLNQVGWVWPVSVAFELDFNPDAWGEREAMQKRSLLQALYLMANEAVREPEPSTRRRLFFDLKAKSELDPAAVLHESAMEEYFGGVSAFEYTGDALLQFLGGKESSPFDHFKTLLDLRRQGLLADIHIAVRKADLDDILLFDELSDGEQVYLGRMALFHLLKGERDALLLLDEPEVHFNDKWKREIVDIIDEALRDKANDVLIATHSSITLTDVFNDEIILFQKHDGEARPVELRSTTFGADPSEVMIRLFGVPDSMGARALEWLDTLLDRDWTQNDTAELEKLLTRIGPGYHRSELRGILRRLKEPGNAPRD